LEEMSSAAAEINAEEYAHLLGIALPQVIHTEVENERSMHVLESLLRKKHRTAEEQRLTELLTLLIEDFEEREYPMPRKAGRPIDMVRHLMDANGLRQTDLLDVFGTASVISEVLNGKRELSKTHIVKLSERFHVSPALFFFADTETSPAAIGRVVTFPARGFKVAAAAKRRWPRAKRRP
jgi:HTH-type transcriptional regulator / antitoxin HigA